MCLILVCVIDDEQNVSDSDGRALRCVSHDFYVYVGLKYSDTYWDYFPDADDTQIVSAPASTHEEE